MRSQPYAAVALLSSKSCMSARSVFAAVCGNIAMAIASFSTIQRDGALSMKPVLANVAAGRFGAPMCKLPLPGSKLVDSALGAAAGNSTLVSKFRHEWK